MTSSPPTRRTVRLRYSIRSILLLTAGVAILCTLYSLIPYDSVIAPSIVYFLTWIIPFASVGYDVYRSRKGLKLGGMVGALLGGVLYIWQGWPVPRE